MVMCRSCFTSTPQILSSTLYLHSPPYGSVVGDTPSHSFVLKQQAQTQVYQKICSLSSRRVQLQPVQREGVRRGGVSENPQSQLHKWLHPVLVLGVRHVCAQPRCGPRRIAPHSGSETCTYLASPNTVPRSVPTISLGGRQLMSTRTLHRAAPPIFGTPRHSAATAAACELFSPSSRGRLVTCARRVAR